MFVRLCWGNRRDVSMAIVSSFRLSSQQKFVSTRDFFSLDKVGFFLLAFPCYLVLYGSATTTIKRSNLTIPLHLQPIQLVLLSQYCILPLLNFVIAFFTNKRYIFALG